MPDAKVTKGMLDRVGIPPRPFFYTLDQVAGLLALTEEEVIRYYCFFEGRSTGRKLAKQMLVVNIQNHPDQKPRWRISERELYRWLKYKKLRVYPREAFIPEVEDVADI